MRVSEGNHRPRRIQPLATERLRNAHLAGACLWLRGRSGRPWHNRRAMTSTPPRTIRSAAALALLVALVAACGQAPPARPRRRTSRRRRSRPPRRRSPRRRALGRAAGVGQRRRRVRGGRADPRLPRGAASRGHPGRERPQRRHVHGDRGPGQPAPRAHRSTAGPAGAFDEAGAGRVRAGEFQQGQPRGPDRRHGAPAQGTPADAAGRLAPRPVHRDALEPGRGPVRRRPPSRCTWSRRRARSVRPRRSPTPTSTPTRSRTRRST